ncbi:phosphate ABC transporter permease PstA [Ectothiorhodospiraceae bacterium 2226]|nr:phosphate ABC transporter permease PstA [Ectothiorhodospiraceae bacterium 2226]
MKDWFKSGAPWIWLHAGAVAISVVMVVGLLLLIGVRGLGHFWPATVYEFDYRQPGGESVRVLGELSRSETVTAAALREAGFSVPEGQEVVQRHLIKMGNRDLTGRDFGWFIGDLIDAWRTPGPAVVMERTEWGNFYGYLVAVKEAGSEVAQGEAAWPEFQARLARANALAEEIRRIERYEIGAVNHRMERLRLDERRLELDRGLDALTREARRAEIAAQREALHGEYAAFQERLDALNDAARRDSVVTQTADGRSLEQPLAHIVRAWQPNAMGPVAKTGHYARSLWGFLAGTPREANTEGGIFPAIFGTVLMVILMSIVVTPLGVLAAIYLREYAKQGAVTRMIRISVNNLAGVPSIVFGVFGLGFFVYFLGGNLDRLFYPEALPSPTFGTPGLMWASLTLALLTLPVVIVATEEGLSRIPRSIREGSLALGATKAETLWKTVVPLAAPAMMTGLILAVARAAGEVAPLMLVGVVKLAPNLPVDGNFPYLHLERKFMHLGFHIFDVGFQSPNVEAARPLVYATALTLVAIIVVLNLTAIGIRNHLREKYRAESD